MPGRRPTRGISAGLQQHVNTSLAIDAANNLIGLLDQWSLIFPNRDNRRFEAVMSAAWATG
jgi:hypothetical protein